MKTIPLRVALAVLVSTLAASVVLAHGQAAPGPTTQKNPHDREMTVSPAKAEDAAPPGDRADPFAFSQDALELRNENAATLYLQAFAALPNLTEDEAKRLDDLLGGGFDGFDAEAAAKLLEGFSLALGICEPAVQRNWCDWGAPLEEKGIETLLPYLAHSRSLAKAMKLHVKVELALGETRKARQMLRRMYVLAGHIGNSRQPVLIDGLVGVAIGALATDTAALVGAREGNANSYWALTTLPSPMFDVSKWMRSERIFLTVSLPALREPENMTADEWFATLRRFRTYMTEPDPNTASIGHLLEDAAATATLAAQAEPYLKARGYSDDRLKAMGMHAVIATYMMDDYRSRFDAITKLVYLPFPEALPLLAAEEERMISGGAQPGPGLLADVLLPAMSKALAAPYRLERQIAALRIVEAVRDHAAHHEGALPASLDEIRLPIPEDSMTGEPFAYLASGNTFTITARRYNEADVNSGFVWRVTMRK